MKPFMNFSFYYVSTVYNAILVLCFVLVLHQLRSKRGPMSLAYHAQLSHMGNRSTHPQPESSCPKCIVIPHENLSIKMLKS